MSLHTRPQFQPQQVEASTTAPIKSTSIGGFFCTGAGTVTINGTDDQGNSVVIVAFTGAANTWYDLPFYIGTNGGTIITGVGATGVLAT